MNPVEPINLSTEKRNGLWDDLAAPWKLLEPVPLTAAYTLLLLALFAVASLSSVLILYEVPPILKKPYDPVIVLTTALAPTAALWLSFWIVGLAAKRGASRAFGYLPVALMFLANAVVWLVVLARLPDSSRAWWLPHVLLSTIVLYLAFQQTPCWIRLLRPGPEDPVGC